MAKDLNVSELNKLIARRFLLVWTPEGRSLVDDMTAPDFVFAYNSWQEVGQGAALFKQVLAQTHDSFPDMRIQADDLVAEGDRVVVRWTYEATHRNNVLFGIPPSGKRVRVSGVTFYRIVNQKIAEEIGFSDTMSLMLQLGAEPNAAL